MTFDAPLVAALQKLNTVMKIEEDERSHAEQLNSMLSLVKQKRRASELKWHRMDDSQEQKTDEARAQANIKKRN